VPGRVEDVHGDLHGPQIVDDDGVVESGDETRRRPLLGSQREEQNLLQSQRAGWEAGSHDAGIIA